MMYPQLVTAQMCVTPITISCTNKLDENGAPKPETVYTGLCNYTEKTVKKMTAERQYITVIGTALFPGDAFPGTDTLEGDASIFEGEIHRRVYALEKARNPDGTENYTRLELM